MSNDFTSDQINFLLSADTSQEFKSVNNMLMGSIVDSVSTFPFEPQSNELIRSTTQSNSITLENLLLGNSSLHLSSNPQVIPLSVPPPGFRSLASESKFKISNIFEESYHFEDSLAFPVNTNMIGKDKEYYKSKSGLNIRL
jgi:hypothetical protein